MTNFIAKIYYMLIKNGLKTIDNVPASLRSKVQDLIDADGEE